MTSNRSLVFFTGKNLNKNEIKDEAKNERLTVVNVLKSYIGLT
jgi:hypothetical protein